MILPQKSNDCDQRPQEAQNPNHFFLLTKCLNICIFNILLWNLNIDLLEAILAVKKIIFCPDILLGSAQSSDELSSLMSIEVVAVSQLKGGLAAVVMFMKSTK